MKSFLPEDEQVFHDVESCISWIYEPLEYGNRQFPGFFSLHSFGFMRDEKTSGKKRMMKTWGHILNGLCEVLENDPKVVQMYLTRNSQRKNLQTYCFP